MKPWNKPGFRIYSDGTACVDEGDPERRII